MGLTNLDTSTIDTMNTNNTATLNTASLAAALTASANALLVKDFYVISIITNPERFKIRPKLFRDFMARMDKYGANLYVVEAAYGDREFEVTDSTNPRHIQLRTDSELWHKENLINIGISRLPATWKYVAWIDGDIDFIRPDWILETVHELQHHPVVQMFEDAIDLGPEHQILQTHKSFAYCYKNGIPKKHIIQGQQLPYYTKFKKTVGSYWHPGYAWAATRDAINTMGGLLDFAILGSGDHHIACCLIGDGDYSCPKNINEQYRKLVLSWEARASKLHKNIGYIKGSVYHFWHGKKKDRRYNNRWDILIANKFDPVLDIYKDWQNLWSLYPGYEKLRDDIRLYFQSRNEDSIDM
uniref:Glycosyltransferase n=1 Tax=viral metagenome TaxID=1070528 RepID=A0A6C0HL51_9ZZZZ